MIVINSSGSQPSASGPIDYFSGVLRVDAPFKGSQEALIRGAT
ncbi:cupin domain-containing protein, partial [Pseudomonas syringae pv. tagetis]